MPAQISEKTVSRLSLYRRLLTESVPRERHYVYSHELAAMVNVTPSQVRRDIMVTGCYGNPSRGYRKDELLQAIAQVVDANQVQNLGLVGIGKLGGALLGYFQGRRPNLRVVAAFDVNRDKVDRLYHGIPCYHLDRLEEVIRREGINTGIVTVPGSEAQAVAERMVVAGVTGILNFAPAPLQLPPNVYVEAIDMAVALEKVAFYARQNAAHRR